MYDRLGRLRFPSCQKVLPLVYDNSLSYYEAICKMTNKVNELIQYMEDFETDVLVKANDYTDNEIAKAKVEIGVEFEEFKNSVGITLESFQSQIDEFGIKYEGEIQDLYRKYVELNNSISTLYTYFDTYRESIDDRFSDMYVDLLRYIEETVSRVDRLYVINPVNGKYESIQVVLNDMYRALNWGSLTAEEYDRMGLTASTYDGKRISAREYDSAGKFALFNELYNRMISPFTGVMTYFGDVINDLANLHKNALTANEYDVKEFSAEVYDGLGASAYSYDWNGRTVIV